EALLLPLAEKHLGISIAEATELTEKLQTTTEREPDFLRLVKDKQGNRFILHLEFQTQNEAEMRYRMAEYAGLLLRKYQLPVKQHVVYLGASKPRMEAQLPPDQWIKGFELHILHDIPVEQTLDSDVPEELILSILTDFPRHEADKVIGTILAKLQQLSHDEATLKRYLQQLMVLSRLRKLDTTTERRVADMPITYDIKTDYLYNKGIEKGIERGVLQVREANEKAVLFALRNSKAADEEIAEQLDVTVEFIRQVKLKHNL
ncbi:MAG: hypothetical protein AAFQ98_18605, partial [Bacteroidota bacterium]